MKFHFKRLFAVLTASALLAPCAFAESITFTGTVAASGTHEVYAPIGGTVASVNVAAGQRVAADDVIAQLSTTKVYAQEAGTVTGLFGQPGDSAETVAEKYGAVLYIEGESVYTIAASTENAYNSTATKFVQVGEEVNLVCYSDGSHTGRGVITSIEGTDYTVRVTSGAFLVGETVSVYRGTSTASTSRIGRGTLNRANPTAVTGSGSIVAFAVQNGDVVQRGDLLFETLDGSFDGLYMSGDAIAAGVDGIVSQLNVQQGASLEKGSVAAVIYPEGAMRVEAEVAETNLASIAVGDPVSIELLWNQDEEVTYEGQISAISAIASESASADGDSAVTYTVYVDFTPDENTRYGMSAVVTTLEGDEPVEKAEDATESDDEPAQMGPEGERPERGQEGFERGERPEGPAGEEGMTDHADS